MSKGESVARVELLSKIASLVNLYPWHILQKRILQTSELLGRPVSVLDLGAGTGNLWQTAPILHLRELGHLGEVTAVEPSCDIQILGVVQEKLVFSEAFLELRDRRFDIVIAFDVIEHLSLEEGYRLLYFMQSVCSTFFGVSTPNGFLWQAPSVDNPLNAHISGWNSRMFRAFGMHAVHGHTGLKILYGPYSTPKFVSNRKLGLALHLISSALAFSPKTAVGISAWGKGMQLEDFQFDDLN